MRKPKLRDIPDIQAADPENALRNLEDFTRRILAVPKKEIDAQLARERAAKRKRAR